MNLKDKNVAILGWGINGIDAAKYLQKEGAKITIFDKAENIDIKDFDQSDFSLSLGEDYLKNGLKEFDYIFRTPGVYRYLPEIIEAENAGTIITSAIKIFFDLCPGKIIGVTGTKGKGTTSTLIYEILKKDFNDVFFAGNIGYPVLKLLPELTNKSLIVLELSSFQLIDLDKSPNVSVVLNITSDHMDWHKNREEYLGAKLNIVKHQNDKDFAVLNYDYQDSKSFEKYTNATKFYFSRKTNVKGVFVKENKIFLDIDSEHKEIGRIEDLLLRGDHNWENVCAAVCASYLCNAKINSIKETIFNFKGLEHRLELVRTVKGVTFYNDSFSTNPQTTMAAVNSFTEPTTLIMGGFDKKLNYDQVAVEIASKNNIKNIILMGDISEVLKDSLLKKGYKNDLHQMGKPNMKQLIEKCLMVTPHGGVVVFSPATSSFDMFNNYKERGVLFKKAVDLIK